MPSPHEPPQEDADRPLFLHEDDYCQIELLPLAARAHCVEELARLHDFSKEHAVEGGGWSDMYVRTDSPVRLRDLALPLGAFHAALDPLLRPREVVTGYSTHRESCPSTLGWGDEGLALFAEQDEGIIQTVWLDLFPAPASSVSVSAQALRAIPHRDDLLLVDWAWGALLPLASNDGLLRYLEARLRPSE